MTKEEVLQNCTVTGMIIKLPAEQLDRKLYQDVAKSLELIGGKWKGGKVFGFVFNEDPTELLEEIANGENRNLKKEYQFFATSDKRADHLVSLVNIKPDHKVLEPSAGQGAIIKAIHRAYPMKNVNWCELMPLNQTFCKKIPYTTFVTADIFNISETIQYDVIIANPPFSRCQDIDHIMKMYDLLKDGGTLVSITSKHWKLSTNKKETAFRSFLNELGASIIEIPAGDFKESGTAVGGYIIIIDKFILK
jgi:phospholipid N-methyltransferase